jgi:hypothetical protein
VLRPITVDRCGTAAAQDGMRRTAILVPVVLMAVAGCGGGNDDDAARRSPAPRTSSPASPTRSGTPFPTAADGTDLAACHKGECEVLVAPGDTIHPPRSVRIEKLTVKSITSDGVSIVGTSPGTMLSLSGQRAGFTSRLNTLSITTVAFTKGKAVLRLVPKS